MGFLLSSAVGKTYPEVAYDATAEKIAAFLESCGDNPAHYAGSSPLMYAVVYSFEAGAQPVYDSDVSEDPVRTLRRLVRGSLDVELNRPVRPGEKVLTVATVEKIEEKSSGELLTVVTKSRTAGGEPLATVRNVHFVRGESKAQSKDGDGGKPANASKDPTKESKEASRPQLAPIDFTYGYVIPPEMPERYSDASLDRNPLHTDPVFAKKVGFPNVILQGSATLAIAQRGIVSNLCPDSPARLFKLGCRFAKPVFPQDQLIVRGQTGGTFDVVNAAQVAVLESGTFSLK